MRLLLIVSFIYLYGRAQSCSTNSLATNLVTLLQTAFLNNAPQGTENPVVTIVQHQVVCLTTTTTRGTYSSASVIVSFTCTGIACPAMNLQQFEFTCGSSSSNMWSPTTNGAPSSGSLTTPLRTDCGLCVQTAAGLMDRFDNATHCVACSPLCNVGLMECTGIFDTDCCNGVVNDMCVENCTAPARPLDSDNYECTVFCDPLSNPDNGTIMFSSGALEGSVASYICDANFVVQGGMNRTCEVNGDRATWSASAPSCMLVPPPTLPPTIQNYTQHPLLPTTTSATMPAPVTPNKRRSQNCDNLCIGITVILVIVGVAIVGIYSFVMITTLCIIPKCRSKSGSPESPLVTNDKFDDLPDEEVPKTSI